MDKALEIGRTSAVGGFKLFVGQIASTVLLAVGVIILQLFIAPTDYGLYIIALIPAATILLFNDWGIGSAIVKYCAGFRSENKEADARRVIVAGITFKVAVGAILTVLSVLMASFLASSVFGRPESSFLILVASVVVFSNSLFSTCVSVFVGFERMGLLVFTTICQAATQLVTAPLLVYMGYGAMGAMAGYVLANIAAGLISVVLLYFGIFRKLDSAKTSKSATFQTLKMLLRYGIPLAILTIVSGLLTQFYSFMMATFVRDVSIIANYSIATNFAVLLTFITVPINTVLFPAFSKLDPGKEPKLLKTVFASSTKYVALLLVPATMAMMVLSAPLIGTIYGNKWPYAPPFLSIYVAINVFAIFGNLSTYNLLTAAGETKMLLKLHIVTLFTGVPLALLIIPSTGIIGLIIVNIIAGLPSMFIAVHLVSRRYGAKTDLKASARILLVSVLAAASSYLFISMFNTVAWVRLAVGSVIFLSVLLTTAPLFSAVNKTDIANLRSMFSNFGIISKLVGILFAVIEKTLSVRARWPKKNTG